MPWLLLALSLATFCFAWSVHSPLWMVLLMLVGLAGLCGFAWLRYKLLFPQRSRAIDDTPMSAEDIRRMREAAAQRGSGRAAPEQQYPKAQAQPAQPVIATVIEQAPPAIHAARSRPIPQPASPPNLRDEGWNPYAGEVRSDSKST